MKLLGNVGELLTSVSALKPGVPVKFTLLRQRVQVDIDVTPGLRPKPPPTDR